jgi:hypothetical protein
MPGCVAYAGEGWSPGVRHMLEASNMAAFCLPSVDLRPATATRELDHMLAQFFGWWGVLTARRTPFSLDAWRSMNQSGAGGDD